MSSDGFPGRFGSIQFGSGLVASGISNREAASQLHLSPKAVEHHPADVFAKLGIASRRQLAVPVRVRGHKGPP